MIKLQIQICKINSNSAINKIIRLFFFNLEHKKQRDKAKNCPDLHLPEHEKSLADLIAGSVGVKWD